MIKKLFFFLFFISGFCALLYQTVWLRLAYANFGINAQVISIVVSVFMLGLVLGSWISGKYLIKLAKKYKIESLYFYSIAEIGIGIGALIIPKLFLMGHLWLLTFGQTNSGAYLGLSALVLSLTMLPWCFLMGTTIPLIMEFLNKHFTWDKNIFSFLYLANTFGAMVGTFLTAGVLIELLGFKKTLLFASFLNFLIALISIKIAKNLKLNPLRQEKKEEFKSFILKEINIKDKFILGLLFITGFSSVGFEVVWNRLFTPILETSVYAFAFILFLYLLGTCVGLLHYRNNIQKGKVLSTKILLQLLCIVSIGQIWFVDPRIGWGVIGVILCVFLISYILGYLTPKQIDKLSQGNPNTAGVAYAINLLGCIIGPIVASYILLPLIGSKLSIIFFSLPLIWFLIRKSEISTLQSYLRKPILIMVFVLLLLTVKFSTTFEEYMIAPNKIIKNDYNATVLAATLDQTDMRSKYLMVNGVGMTTLTPITKIMAHLPLASLPQNPKKALVICFGMGTTFRSAASWGFNTTAVELTPSVKEFFSYFFSDANQVLAKSNNQIIIDDGRRFLERTSEKYDLIAIDPPPPVEAAGSSLLYSKEFYEIAQTHLSKNGILAQWYPGGNENDKALQAVARSLVDVFPYVEVYQSVRQWGYHFFASNEPINIPNPEQIVKNMPLSAQDDLMEWNDYNDPNILSFIKRIISGKININQLLNSNKKIEVTDDQPYNEYFLVRNAN
ncbi:MAG: fused MFS/spermidine synthase [Minisyncoccia bacterium]